MKRLILDHYRRWSWVLALCALLEFGLGWFIATGPKLPFEFFAFLLAGWTGAFPLNFDFQRGLLRALGPLPLTGRQLGRAWWLATVPIPAVVLAALLFSGATTFCHFHPSQVFPADRLAMASLFTLVWLGIGFTLIFNAMRGLYGNGRELACNLFISALSGIAFFGSMVFAQDASKSPFRSAILLGVGAVLSAVGWVRAEQFELGRAGLYLGRAGQVDLGRPGQSSLGRPGFRLTPLEPKIPPGRYCAPRGPGGIPFLLRTTFVSIFLYLAAMSALMALLVPLQQWLGQGIPWDQEIVMLPGVGSFIVCGFVIIFGLLPVMRQLRFLRTLPVSATRLAAVMFALTILPIIAVGALAAAVAGTALGAPAAIPFLKSFTFILAPAALCVFLTVWLGDGMQAYALLYLTLFGFIKIHGWFQVHLNRLALPFGLIGPIVAISLLLGFLLTCGALLRSSRAYRVRPNPSGHAP
jgi:hypothetical protein